MSRASTNLTGPLEEATVVNLLQMLSLNRTTGCLDVHGPSGALGVIYLVAGRVTHAQAGALRGVEAVARMLAWQRGSFSLLSGVTTAETTIDVPVERLLLDASYAADTGVGRPAPLSGSSVLKLAPADAMATGTQVTAQAIPLVAQLNGQNTLEAAAARLGRPLDEVLSLAEKLLAAGVVTESRAERLVPPGFIADLAQALVHAIGPIGEIVLDDTLADLHLQPDTVPLSKAPVIVNTVVKELKRPAQRQEFDQALRAIRAKHGL
ncbi:MAG TPA: DUF4388 domain-containing protein [Deinococcales bacterium]|nr:DUF4388 domain-containing protein [Deinococcales bacterium]